MIGGLRRPTRKVWLAIWSALIFWGVVILYFVAHPPLPSYIQPPPGSSVQMSRRFFVFMWGPDYYCRVHSPLGAWQTARHMKKSSGYPQYPAAVSRLGKSSTDMGGCALKRAGSFVGMNYSPDGMRIGRGKVSSEMRIWPEAVGSTIEFYIESRF